MAERILILEVFLALLLICREVDRDDLVRNPELLQNYGHALSASRLSKAIYLDDHYDTVTMLRRGCSEGVRWSGTMRG